ncbi:MAG: glycosyltransferase [Parcubacteria group bacterium]|nr:glycosyltransferase [Parcubacteria group bacterium]
MTICYFGSYNRDYSRNRIIIKGLRKNGVNVIECHERAAGFKKLVSLFRKHRRIRDSYDIMIVGFAGQGMALFARLITRKPIVLDAFYSLYNTVVEDRKLHAKLSWTACHNYFLDWASARVANLVLLDTQEHIKYFCRTFHQPPSKFARVWIGADTDIFYPQDGLVNEKTTIGFQGTFVPLQGVEYIIQALGLIKDPSLELLMVGNGQTLNLAKKIARGLELNNVKFHDVRIPAEAVPQWVARMDICLGIFGNTSKTKMVIPNKVYEYLAMGKPVITADTPAIRELFDETELMLVPIANPESIARAIITLKGNPELRQAIARQGHAKFTSSATPELIGKNLKSMLKCLIK